MIKKILSKGSKERSEEDLKLMERFLQSNQFFANLKQECDREALLECFRALTFEQFSQKETVFSFGDYGYEFFIIIKGRVSIQVPTMVTLHADRKELNTFLIDNYD